MMATWAPISYRGYYDVPRIFLTRYEGEFYLFNCPFSEELDDYPDDYDVFLMPTDTHEENLPTDWTLVAGLAVRRLGSVPVTSVTFDSTRRKQVDTSVLDALLAPAGRSPG
jgi:hypothetical protein